MHVLTRLALLCTVALTPAAFAAGPMLGFGDTPPERVTLPTHGVRPAVDRAEPRVAKPAPRKSRGNETIQTFTEAKKLLSSRIYKDHRRTIYCGATYSNHGEVNQPRGFKTPAHEKRAERIEWEHVVPAEHFGRTFVEWRTGVEACRDHKGKTFKGRKCAETNPEFARMEADLYNLYPAIGAVNALRSNYDFADLGENARPTFGSCKMTIETSGKVNRVQPPERARGVIARTYKYMASAYPRYTMSAQTRRLMDAWDRQYPVDAWECERARRIEAIQKNPNEIVKAACRKAGL